MPHNQQFHPDPDILARILLLQSAMVGAPDVLRLGELCCGSCKDLPGVGGVAFYQENELVICTDGFDEGMDTPMERIQLNSATGCHGNLTLGIADEGLFAAYLPYLHITANLFSLVLENLNRGKKLMELNRGLAREVAVRTQRLQQSEERFRALVESAPEAIVLVDPGTMMFTEVNSKATQIFGHAKGPLLAMGPLDASPAQQPDGTASVQGMTLRIGAAMAGQPQVFEWTFKNSGGEAVMSEVRLVRTDFGAQPMLRASVSDISERHKLQQQLQQSLKMEAVGQLSGGLAHDFNNLLVAIVGNAELLKIDLDESDARQEMLDEIMRASRRGTELTQRLLSFSREHALRPQDVNLGALVEGLQGFLKRSLGGEGVEIRTEVPAELWACRADPGQIENCLLNLAINSRDAMPEGGRIIIETRNETIERGLASELGLEPGDYVSLAVIDNGTGIPEGQLSKVLEPFYTTKEVGKGTGLGLSMVYGFVKQSKGTVQVRSCLGEGTTVRLFLPRGKCAISAPAAKSNVIQGSEGELVLLVEDDDSVRCTVEVLLLRLGYRVRSAADARSAMEALGEMPDADLLLTDIRLTGGVHGPELARLVRSERPQIKLLFMSGYVGDEDPFEEGFEDVTILAKPFTRSELAAEVRLALEGLRAV